MKNKNFPHFSMRRIHGGNPDALIHLLDNSIGNTKFIDKTCYDENSKNWNLKYLFWMTKGLYGIYLKRKLIAIVYIYVQNGRHYIGFNVMSGSQHLVNLGAIMESVKQLSLYCYQIKDLILPGKSAKVSDQGYTFGHVAY